VVLKMSFQQAICKNIFYLLNVLTSRCIHYIWGRKRPMGKETQPLQRTEAGLWSGCHIAPCDELSSFFRYYFRSGFI